MALPIHIGTAPVMKTLPSGTRRRIPIFSTSSPTKAAFKISNNQVQTIARRSADYKPSIWDNDYFQSLKSQHVGESHSSYMNKLKEEMRMMVVKELNPLMKLELIDNLQRLGLSYHFEDEIKESLEVIFKNCHSNNYRDNQDSLYATALEFRLLRQQGCNVPQDIFHVFKDQSGSFMASLGEDIKGMLYLYEASFLSMEGETILDDARSFANKHLKEAAKHNKDPYLSTLVRHSLEIPLHWRMPRMEGRWFIDVYQQSPDMNPVLLNLAKVDFNMCQAAYQEDLKHASTWWTKTGLGKQLGFFIRDRLAENFLWSVGLAFQPQYGYYRRMATQVNALMTTIDDIYDVYGTLDELELFTNAAERWDINALEELPEYMRTCFFSLYNSFNEISFNIFREQGINVLPYTKKAFANLCKAYLLEAQWYYNKYTPSLQEYIDNAVTSVTAPIMLYHVYILLSNTITKEGLECFMESDQYPNIIRWASMVTRLTDDLGTSPDEMKRGDVPKSIQCYMHETGASEEEAREYIQDLISLTWKKMNKARWEKSPFSKLCVDGVVNIGRTSQFMYEHGDGHSSQDDVVKNHVSLLLVHPVD